MNETFLSEICNSQFAKNLGQTLNEKTPEIKQILFQNLGEERTNEIMDSVTDYLNKQT